MKSFTAALIIAALPALAVAQYSGPQANKQGSKKNQPDTSMTVQQILQSPKDDQDVRLRGNLLRQVGDEEYIFSDGTGEIVAEIDDDDFPGQVSESTQVEIEGEVDTSRNRAPEIDVERVRIVQ